VSYRTHAYQRSQDKNAFSQSVLQCVSRQSLYATSTFNADSL
jgi:hypothetical protein